MVKKECLLELRKSMAAYAELSEETWRVFSAHLKIEKFEKSAVLVPMESHTNSIYYIVSGAIRSFYSDDQGSVFNKNLFLDGQFAASKVALLEGKPSYMELEALEETISVVLHYPTYRSLMHTHEDLQRFYIAYLEKNWVVVKEKNEISRVLKNATARYRELVDAYPKIENRIPLKHIAAHLGITPTQLSRIRSKLN